MQLSRLAFAEQRAREIKKRRAFFTGLSRLSAATGWVALEQLGQRTLLESLVRQPGQLQAARESVQRYREWNTQAVGQIPGLVEGLLGRNSLFSVG